MRVQPIESLDDPRISAYRDLRDRDLKAREGLFIAEGRFIVPILLAPRSLYRPHSLLLTPLALDAIRPALEPLPDDAPVYLAEQDLLSRIVGFDIHRGCLAAGLRPDPVPAESLLPSLPDDRRSLLLVLEALNNHDNIGALLRNAAAFGVSAVLMDDRCADPLYRKAIRVSMGGALVVPHARFRHWPGAPDALRAAGYVTVALTPDPGVPDIADVAESLRRHDRLALLLGAEGPGLSPRVLRAADHHARIPMRTDLVDSLNVAAAGAIALDRLSRP